MASSEVSIIIQAVDKASGTLSKIGGNLAKMQASYGKILGELSKPGKSKAELQKLESELRDLDKQFGNVASNSKLMFTAIGAGIGVVTAAGAAIKGLADGFMNYAFQVEDFGRIIGATPEEASKLIQVADDVRLSVESMTTAMRAAITKGYSPTVEGLGKMADEYNRLAPGIERSRYLIETFGRSGLEMAKLMELGSKQIREMGDSIEGTGLLMTKEGIAKATEYYRTVDKLTEAWTGLRNNAGAVTLPIIVKVIEDLTGWLEGGQKSKNISAELAKAFSEGALTKGDYAKASILAMGSAEDMAKAQEYLKKTTRDMNEQIRSGESAIRNTGVTYDDVRNSTLALVMAQYDLKDAFGAAFLGSAVAASEMSNSLAKVHSAMISINNAVGNMQFDNLQTQLQIDAAVNFKMPDITSELANWVKSDKWRAGGGELVVQAFIDLQPRMAQSGADVREKLAKELGALELAVKVSVGEISKDEARRMFMDAFGGSYKDAAAAIDVAAEIDTSSVDAIKDDLKNDDFLAPLKPEVDEGALSAVRAQIGQPIYVKVIPVGGGSGKGDISWLEISQNRDINGNGIIGKALGGPVSARRPYVVGEQGPEIFIPKQAGDIVPNRQIGGSYVDIGGIYINGGGQSPQAIAQAVIRQLNASMRSARQSGLGYVGS